jgi:hypothetical protein
MSISSLKSSCSKTNCVPQWAQKLRVPFALDLNRAGAPRTNRKCDRAALNQATNGAPVVRRQTEQWQWVS